MTFNPNSGTNHKKWEKKYAVLLQSLNPKVKESKKHNRGYPSEHIICILD